MRGATFDHVTFDDTNLGNAHLICCHFKNCQFRNTNLRLAQLTGAKFADCILDGVRFDCTEFSNGAFFGGSLARVVFDGATLSSARFQDVELKDTSFRRTDLTAADFFHSVLNDVDFTEADLSVARLDRSRSCEQLRLIRTKMCTTYLGDLDLSKVDVRYIDWQNREYRVGEELEADNPHPHNEGSADRKNLYAQAVAYRALGERYRQVGHTDEYLQFRYRAMETRRKLLAIDSPSSRNMEFLWLTLLRSVDGYGTSFGLLLRSFCCVVLVFSLVYWCGWTMFQRDWAKWYRTKPGGTILILDENANYMKGHTPPPHEYCRARKGWARAIRWGQVFPYAVGLSLRTVFMFAEKLVDVPGIVSLFRRREECLVPTNSGRIVAGLAATMGLLLCYLA